MLTKPYEEPSKIKFCKMINVSPYLSKGHLTRESKTGAGVLCFSIFLKIITREHSSKTYVPWPRSSCSRLGLKPSNLYFPMHLSLQVHRKMPCRYLGTLPLNSRIRSVWSVTPSNTCHHTHYACLLNSSACGP